jgi:hypothetical protein
MVLLSSTKSKSMAVTSFLLHLMEGATKAIGALSGTYIGAFYELLQWP